MKEPRLRGYYTGLSLEPDAWHIRVVRARPLPAWPWVALVIVVLASVAAGMWV